MRQVPHTLGCHTPWGATWSPASFQPPPTSAGFTSCLTSGQSTFLSRGVFEGVNSVHCAGIAKVLFLLLEKIVLAPGNLFFSVNI